MRHAGALLRQGQACVAVADDRGAQAHFEQLLEVLIGLHAPLLEVPARAELVRIDLACGEVSRAIRHAQRCAELVAHLGDAGAVIDVRHAELQAHALLAQARVAVNLGESDEGLALLETALPLMDRFDNPVLGYACRNMLGMVMGDLLQPEASMNWHLAAREQALRAGRTDLAAIALSNSAGRWLDVGDHAMAAGQVEQAQAAWQRTLQACEEAAASAQAHGVGRAEFVALANRAAALGHLGRIDDALAGFEHAAMLSGSVGELTGAIQLAAAQVRLMIKHGDLGAARAKALAAIAQAHALGTRKALENLHRFVVEIDEARGDFASALHHHKQMFEVHKAVAADRAAQRAQVMAVRLETEKARAEAVRERHRASHLEAENAALAERAAALSEEALQDALTGLANRRRLDLYLAQRHAQALERNLPLCVALLDIDHFKAINDGHSHAVGDRVLHRVGEMLRAQCRGDDLAARYGGEEFVLVFDGVGPVRAGAICERVRQAIQRAPWSDIAAGLAVTASFGVCDIARHASPAEGMARADALMYAAKAAGRNRTCSDVDLSV